MTCGGHQVHPYQGISLAGSVFAVVAGLYAYLAEKVGRAGIMSPALLAAFAGVLTAAASILVPLVRIWADVKKGEREDKWRRHDLAGKLNAAVLQIAYLQVEAERKDLTIAEHKRHIDDNRVQLSDQHALIMRLAHGQPIPELPLPPGTLSQQKVDP